MKAPNIVDDLRAAAERFPDRAALLHATGSMTFSGLYAASAALAGGLAGLKMRERMVCILGPTSPELALTYYAAFQSGNIAVPLNYSFRHLELETTLASIRPETIIVHADFVERLSRVSPLIADAIPHRFIYGSNAPVPRGFAPFDQLFMPKPFEAREERSGLIFHTSGTTGRPKGVLHSLLSASHFSLGYKVLFRGEDRPVTIIGRNIYHSGGFYNLTGALSCATTCVLRDPMTGFDAADYVGAAQQHRATQFFLSVSMLNALLDSPALSPRTFENASFISAGADEVKPSHHRRLARYTSLPLSVRYSSTESTAVTVNESGTRIASVGKPFGHFSHRLDRNEPGGPGELLLKGPGVFSGYHNNPEENGKAFTADGWYRTGDLFDEDGEGNLLFRGRKKDAMKVGGKFVYPEELEAVASQFAGVTEAVAVPVPDRINVETPVLFVRTASAETPFDSEKLIEFLKERISDYKVPVAIHAIDAFPLTKGGKIDRRELAGHARTISARGADHRSLAALEWSQSGVE